MPPKKVVTSRELAEIAGVSHMTVTRAFRNDRLIKAETRDRILKLAEKHGYRPNPIHSLHALAKGQKKQKTSQGTLAFVQLYEGRKSWSAIPYLAPYLKGVKEQAAKLGFSIDEFSLNKQAHSPEQLDRILKARGIKGIILGPIPSNIEEVQFNWSDYCSVAMQQLSWKPRLHGVQKDWIHAITTMISEAEKLEYKRLGLLITINHNTEHQRSIEGCMLAHQQSLPKNRRIPICIYRGPTVHRCREQIKEWVEKYHPDCIINGDSKIVELLQELGLSVPEDVGVIHTALTPDLKGWTGYTTEREAFGRAAVDMVVNRIVRNEIGLPSESRDLYLRGNWHHGKTTR